jgi:uncharacterized repeat protein (TIGR01451 family)
MKSFWKRDGLLGAALMGAVAMGVLSVSATPAHAVAMGEGVTLASVAMIERVEVDAAGREKTVLKSPGEVIIVPGDRVVFTLTYSNKGSLPATGFRATNPMPGPVQFIGASEEWAEVSVDGGKSWGKLSALTVSSKAADGSEATRSATPEDVTHVRWVFANAIAPGSQGSISYRGVIK